MRGNVSFDGLLAVAIVAAAVPIVLGFFPRLPIPDSVLEILAGILIGPAVLGWVHTDDAINVLAKLGVAFLLFLAGLELDFRVLRGKPLRYGAVSFVASLVIGLVLAFPLYGVDAIVNPLLVAIILSATSLGIVVPVLKDAGKLDTPLSAFIVASCSVAEFGSIVVLSMFFSGAGSPEPVETGGKLFVLFLAVAVVAVVTVRGRWNRLNDVLFRMQETSSQIRVRIAMVLLLALLVLSETLRFDAILGTFMAGALISALTDPDREEDLGHLRHKLDGIGFGLFVPVFFVTTGLTFPVNQLFSDATALIRVPVFLVLLLAVRGLPALLLRSEATPREGLAAGLLQATSLSFIVVATQIGVGLGELRPINAASLVAAGMLSVLIFPAGALVLLRQRGGVAGPEPAPEVDVPDVPVADVPEVPARSRPLRRPGR
jgi:Kef-type K+ transport system membrane component KefB